MTEQLTGAQSLVRSLEAAGVDTVFGVPGGAILPAYQALLDSSRLRHVRVRHEQGAGLAAKGYAQATGRVGVCMATSGSGATNLVTPLADAYMDSVPVVAVTSQVPARSIGTDAFQEADIRGITLPITKHNYLVTDPAAVPRSLAEAFHIAGTGRPGPVLVDIAKDALEAPTGFSWPAQLELPGYRPVARPHSKQVREAARLLAESDRPVLLVGGGVVTSGAFAELRVLAELTGAPVTTTLMARGALPDSHPQHLGMPGMYGTVPAVNALQHADLIIALGARFDDRVTGRLETFAPDAVIVHADIDPAEISKNRPADVPIVGDCREVIADLVVAVQAERQAGHQSGTGPSAAYPQWWRSIADWRSTLPPGYAPPADGSLLAAQVVHRLGQLSGPDAVVVSGVGLPQLAAAQFIPYEKPRSALSSGGLGTMGYALPAALGAKVGRPEAAVWAVDGPRSVHMTSQELATCVIERVPVKVAILHPRESDDRVPDFVRLAEAHGCVGLRAHSADQLDAVIEKALGTDDLPVVIDVEVHGEPMAWPVVDATTTAAAVAAARRLAPQWVLEG